MTSEKIYIVKEMSYRKYDINCELFISKTLYDAKEIFNERLDRIKNIYYDDEYDDDKYGYIQIIEYINDDNCKYFKHVNDYGDIIYVVEIEVKTLE